MAIMQSNDWDPSVLFSKDSNLVPTPKILPDDSPFGVDRDLVADLPANPKGTVDICLDDTVALTGDVPGSDHVQCLKSAVLLALATAAHPKHDQEPLPREEMAAPAKLLAEEGPEEMKIILGWVFNFRSLAVSLPDKSTRLGKAPSRIW